MTDGQTDRRTDGLTHDSEFIGPPKGGPKSETEGGGKTDQREKKEDRGRHKEEMQERRRKSPKRRGEGKKGQEQGENARLPDMRLRSRLLLQSPARTHGHGKGRKQTPV